MQSDLDYIMRSFSLSRTKAEGVKLGKPQSIHRNHRFDAPWLRSERKPVQFFKSTTHQPSVGNG
jgi:hypothetical protein